MANIGQPPILRTTDEAVSLAEKLVSTGPIPRKAAAAALSGRIEGLAEEAGYACPVICTPEERMEDQP